ncbi:unnamed protein product [Owenia fusiformis]|uniref:Serine/threonine-protein kinase ATR n=1 Tax=Owenia fusiformis TaxID=6347 RepID=A0A8S4PY44_OWEFU|nr:unnamed protein product [Owenia fusiformis]
MTLTDTRANVRMAGIKAFPLILHLLGPNANHLVYDLLHNLMTDKSPVVLSALATIAGPLACVVSRKAVLQRPLSCKDGKIYCNISLICLCCEENSDGSNVSSPRARPKLVDPAMFLPFLQLLTATRDIKLGLTQSLSKMFGHIEVRSNNQATVNMLNSCLNLIEDPDYQTRVEFSKVVQFLLGDSSSESASETDQLIVTKLAGIMQSHDHVHPHLLETVILTLGQLGRVAEGKLQLVVLISLLKSMISTQPFIAAVAHEQLRDLANHKHVTLQDLFKRHRKSICQFIVDSVYDSEPSSGSGKEPLGILHEVAILFNYDDVKTFLQSTEIYMLPPLVSKATAKASALIKLIASQLDKTKRQCLTRNTAYIFSYLLCFCQGRPGQYDKALHFLRQETGLELGSLLRLDMQNVENELLLHLSDNYTQMFKGLSMVASYDELEYKGPKDIKTKDQMAAFLQPRLLGFLAYFDSKFLNKTIPWEEKLMALESLISLMKMMGAHYITPVRVKLMATLKIVLRFKEKAFPSVCCRAWECFVKSLDMASLGPMLSQIIVILLPLFNQLPNQVAEIFRFLIVKNRVQLEPHFHELYFMPESRELADINEVLAKFTAGHSKRASLQIQISHLLNGVSHESLDVRLRALKKLRQLLHTHQVELHYMVMGKETSDPVISQLVSALLSGCRESDPTARNLVGECLGELGAVDPGRLDLNVNDDNKDMAKFHADVNDDNYGYDLINELVRAFLAAENTETQDCSAYALQEIASVYGISNTAGNHTAGKKLWLRFPGHIQEILVPLLHSKYKVTSSENWSQVPKVIYGSHKGKYFEKWISTWTGYLITMVKDTKASMIFKSCSVVVKHDHNTALYLLPNIIVQALIDGTANQTQQISNEVLAVLNDVKQPDTQQGMASDFRHLAAQTIFSILGMVVKWQRHRIQYLSAIAAQHKNRSGNNHENDGKYKAVKQFIDKIPLDILASASFNCQAYTRSLMYFEQFINMKKENIHQHLDFFQKLYIAMDEPDGVASVIAIREDQPTLTEQILAHESIGQLRDASACYERAIQQDNNCISHYEGLIKCQMELGQFETAACQVDGILTKKPEWHGTMNSYRVEAAWKLGQWDNLRTHLDQERGKRTWAVGIGNTLMLAKDRDEEGFLQQLQIVRSELMGPLSAASMEKGSYQRGYEYIVRLHMLNELEQGVRELLHFPTRGPQERSGLAKLIELWDSRLSLTQASFRMKEPILNLRRTLFSLAEGNTDVDLHTEIGKSWLRSAKVARKVGHLQTAFSFLLNGSSYHLPELFVERAKWFWAKNDHDLAQTCIEKGLQEFYPDCTFKDNALRRDTTEKGLLRRIECAKALLLWGMYSEETSSIESNEIVKRYRDVIDMNPTWEDGHFYLAKYYDKIMVHLTNSDRPDRQRSILEPIIENYGKALRNGSQYIYQTMPRMLTIWLEYGSKMVESESKQNKNETAIGQQRFTLQTMNESIAKLGNELPPYTFLTAFPQLISRICHPHNMVFQVLSELISNMMHNYPQQAMWLMMAVSKSSYKIRQSRCHTIIAKARQKDKSLNKFIHDAIKLADRLLDLCNRHVESGQNVFSISQHFKPLQRLMDDVDFSKIIIPLQTMMNVTLPTTSGPHSEHDPFPIEQTMMNVTLPTTSGPHSEHDPFPMEQVYIDGFDDTVEVLPSLQKPKKITMKGSDGKRYVMMCKPKDDLRKDCRLMEFNSIVNKCLRKDPESRKRQLHIRTYMVVPLNEECGLIEWVDNCHGLRNILIKIYKDKKIYMTGSELKQCRLQITATLEEKMRVYKTKLLPRHPPVFKEWFLKTFPDPTSWYMARQSYARTTAVMSMVGYILGLGDRHGENILFDSTNGDVVHVDFNCLFNKGDTFDWPELVPFRLTRNMVDAMGPMGYEGLFRRACEVTMRVMRDQMDPLMSVLKTFIFDPLVEWAGKPTKGRSNSSETGEIKNDQAQMNVQNIECRMKGELKANKHKRSRGLPLSIEGHVNHLIKESTKDENLCAMYIGWAAYM